MNIRNANESDLDDICMLSDQVNLFHHHNTPNTFSLPSGSEKERVFWSERLNQEDSVFFVTDEGTKLQGFITAKITQNMIIPFLVRKRVCRIGTIVVADEFQNRGIGKAMMKKVEQWALDKKADEIRLEVMEFNKNAQGFYDSLGFGVSSRILSKSIDK